MVLDDGTAPTYLNAIQWRFCIHFMQLFNTPICNRKRLKVFTTYYKQYCA